MGAAALWHSPLKLESASGLRTYHTCWDDTEVAASMITAMLPAMARKIFLINLSLPCSPATGWTANAGAALFLWRCFWTST